MAPAKPVRTPLVPFGSHLFIKDETRQHTSAFKYRGTFARICASTHDGPLVAASTGNHAAATAMVGAGVGRPVHIFVPAATPEVKIRRITDAGGQLHLVDGDYHACYLAAEVFAQRIAGELVESFDHFATIAGHAALFAEVLADMPVLPGRVYVPVGGGGLLAAAALAFASTGTEVVGVEFAGADGMHQSLRAGQLVDVPVPCGVPAEGLLVRRVGRIPFAIASSVGVARIVQVTEEQLRDAVAELWWSAGIRAELAGAAGLAGFRHDRPGLVTSIAVVSGGNIDPALHQSIVAAYGQGHAA